MVCLNLSPSQLSSLSYLVKKRIHSLAHCSVNTADGLAVRIQEIRSTPKALTSVNEMKQSVVACWFIFKVTNEGLL